MESAVLERVLTKRDAAKTYGTIRLAIAWTNVAWVLQQQAMEEIEKHTQKGRL